jgi:hypothetical protein
MKKSFLPLTITGILFFGYGCEVSPFKDFDVGTNTFDANVFPLDPKWGKQIEHDTIPNPGESCPIQSDSDNPDDWTKSPQHPNCTSFAVTFNGGKFCGPHINFMPVTYEGIVTWNGHSTSIFPFGDDDYALNVKRDDARLYTTTGSGQVHIEFSSDETVDNWDDTHTWWDTFHHHAVDDNKPPPSEMIDGSPVIVIGLLNLDTEHGNGGDGKPELHPVYAMFVHLKNNDLRPSSSSWAFFVRNWGDQGYCGDNQQNLYTREQKIKVKIPNAMSLSSYNISKGAQNADELSPMEVGVQPYGDGMLLTFTLLLPENQSWFVGDLTFIPRAPENTTGGASAAAPAADGNQNITNDNVKNPDPDLEARINRLPDSSKKELYAQLRNLVTRKKPVQVQPAFIAEPAKLDETYHKSPLRVVVNRDLVRPKEDSAGKLKRQKKLEFVKKYLAEKGVE